MSTRWYPLYQRGNPQLRVFLPNFWMKLVEPIHQQHNNIVQFIVSTEMTRYDIKNYLEKIYNVSVVEVKTRIVSGEYNRGSWVIKTNIAPCENNKVSSRPTVPVQVRVTEGHQDEDSVRITEGHQQQDSSRGE
uniref:Large ribosomal subunit protein uL23m n=1 Tax=Timema shepardi TaxID=629360 RepID=A0A7R9G2R0_TIMSH|nr:unnamed protein product [Timema shepardi]